MKGPWREPMVWLVVGLPAAVVAASIAMIVMLVRSGPLDNVPDDVRRTSQMQVADLSPDMEARRLQLSALLRAEDGVIELRTVVRQLAGRRTPYTVTGASGRIHARLPRHAATPG